MSVDHLGRCARSPAAGRRAVVIRSASASARNAASVAVGELVDASIAGGRRAADDLVVDVGDVHDPGHA